MTSDFSSRFATSRRIPLIALAVFILDQLTKLVVVQFIPLYTEQIVLDGFFKFVHWTNTGAAFSRFTGQNNLLAIVSVIALIVLYLTRHHFEDHTLPGQMALGLIFGGILGNLLDRIVRNHVVDFIYFFVVQRDGSELGFPAFNIADSAICVGVGILFFMSWWSSSAQPASNGKPAA